MPRSSVSSADLIRRALLVWGEMYGKEITPLLAETWLKLFSNEDPAALAIALERATKECAFRPVAADIYARMPGRSAPDKILGAEDAWQKVLQYVKDNGNLPEGSVNIKGALSGAEARSLRAIGGVNYLESCPASELPWVRKRFFEIYEAVQEQRGYTEMAALPEEMKSALADLAKKKSL